MVTRHKSDNDRGGVDSGSMQNMIRLQKDNVIYVEPLDSKHVVDDGICFVFFMTAFWFWIYGDFMWSLPLVVLFSKSKAKENREKVECKSKPHSNLICEDFFYVLRVKSQDCFCFFSLSLSSLQWSPLPVQQNTEYAIILNRLFFSDLCAEDCKRFFMS